MEEKKNEESLALLSCFIAFNNRTKMRGNKINNTTRKGWSTWKIFPPLGEAACWCSWCCLFSMSEGFSFGSLSEAPHEGKLFFWGEILALWVLERQQKSSLRLNLTWKSQPRRKTLKAFPLSCLRLIDFLLWLEKVLLESGKNQIKTKSHLNTYAEEFSLVVQRSRKFKAPPSFPIEG